MAMIMPPNPLFKQKSWSPDAYRDEAWHRRRSNSRKQKQRSKSVTDEDLDELKACIELGFGFEPPEEEEGGDQRLSDTLPALGLYYAVNRSYKSSTTPTSSFSPTPSECDSHSPVGSPHTMFGPGMYLFSLAESQLVTGKRILIANCYLCIYF